VRTHILSIAVKDLRRMTTLATPPHTPAAPCFASSLEAPPQAFAWPVRKPLLYAAWRNLILLNFKIDPAVLAPHVPVGTELDFFDGKTYVSIVGFQFQGARLFGLRIPYHSDFEEVNLRFYVRRRAEEGWRRGVVFIREIAPRWCVAVTAKWLYGENYLCVPMSHKIIRYNGDTSEPPNRVEYRWRLHNHYRHVAIEPAGPARVPDPDSHEEFIIEHYWGYSALPRGRSKEYCVAHRPWRVSPAARVDFNCDIAALYGPRFAPYLEVAPSSAFWADGSSVRVYPGRRLA
jgi:uncharacterized protein YqjF (DUF2071 family)